MKKTLSLAIASITALLLAAPLHAAKPEKAGKKEEKALMKEQRKAEKTLRKEEKKGEETVTEALGANGSDEKLRGQEKQRVKKSEQEQKELGKGSEQGQTQREEVRKKWWKFWE